MKRFLIDTSVRNAEGTQTWFVDAETEAEALAKFKAGDCDLYESNVEVTSLDEPEISGEVPLDDFGHFAPEEALTCSVCGVETPHPWHYSTPTSRHEHACDKCWPTAQPAQKEIEWPKARDVGRLGDMSPVAHLRVGLDRDNDVYVSVRDDKEGAVIEFCTPGSGGGDSPATRTALIALMVAIEKDNAERPNKDWWAKRLKGSAA